MQQRDLHAIHDRLLSVGRLGSVFAEASAIDAVDGNLVFGDEIADNGISHRLRGLYAAAAVSLHLDDVSLFASQGSGQCVKVRFAGWAEGRTSCGEWNYT